MPQFLAQNALSTLTLHGLLYDPESGADMAAELRRVPIPVDLVNPWKAKISEQEKMAEVRRYKDELPVRPPSKLPPPRQQHLEATLGQALGDGRSSVVYALDNVNISDPQPHTVAPSLVVKVARMDRVAWLAREAWFYDELESFQGSVVPYCYGWFEMELGELLSPSASPRCAVSALDHYPKRRNDFEEDYDDEEGDDINLRYYEGEDIHPLLAARDCRHDIVSVLILERLGGMLRLGKPVTRESGDGAEIWAMFREISEQGIVPWQNVHRENILRALPLPAGIAPPCSPFRKAEYGWRLVDFEYWAKTSYTPLGARGIYGGQCIGMFEHVTNGWGHVYSDDETSSDETSSEESGSEESDSEGSTCVELTSDEEE